MCQLIVILTLPVFVVSIKTENMFLNILIIFKKYRNLKNMRWDTHANDFFAINLFFIKTGADIYKRIMHTFVVIL